MGNPLKYFGDLRLSQVIKTLRTLGKTGQTPYFAGLAATVAGTVTSFTVFTRRRAAR